MKKRFSMGMAAALLLLSGPCLAQKGSENPSLPRILVAYFSLWGNAKYDQNVDVSTSASIVIEEEKLGITEVIARQITQAVGEDLLPIQSVRAYPADFQSVINRNHQEAASRTSWNGGKHGAV